MIEYSKYTELRKELRGIHIVLDGDPAATGIGHLNEKIAEVHALKERVSAILGDAIANVADRERVYQEAKIIYEAKYDLLLNQDESIKSLKSEGLRRASCNAKLPDEYGAVCSLKIDLGDAESFQKLTQSKYNLLDSANNNISRQISVIQLQLDIGEVRRSEDSRSFKSRTIGVK